MSTTTQTATARFVEAARRRMGDLKINRHELAQRAGLPHMRIYRLLAGKGNLVDLDTIAAVAVVLGLDLNSVLRGE